MEVVSATAILIIPWMVYGLYRWPPLRVIRKIDPIVVAYGIGFAYGAIFGPPKAAVGKSIAAIAIGLCLPLLIMTMDIRSTYRLFPKAMWTLVGFALCVVTSGILAQPFLAQTANPKAIAAMITATFVGSAPNLAAVGLALNVEETLFLQVQSTDLVVSAGFFMFLVALGIPFGLRYLPLQNSSTTSIHSYVPPPQKRKSTLLATALPILVIAAAGFSTYLLPDSYRTLGAILTVSVLSLGLASIPVKGFIPNTTKAGEICFWHFCAATGSQLKLETFLELPIQLLIFTMVVLVGALLLHLLLCRLFKIDRQLFFVTAIAGIFSPVMVVPLSKRVGGETLTLIGLGVGLFGLGIGTISGLLVAYF